ncbi:MAG TPA: hypothetical protein VFG42_02935 [Baekduia sp.]|uniref:hypothetical protein n=1 Tax=Baekduia sp. TaxID=2600305 RepID=UPI002D79195B|nr:hypothetical protein [Baekduia sp.]HET6505722.1 hypothetical protein [Baekduia sp.]
MPSTDAPNWWADVQQEREDLAGSGRRPADDWLGEDIDFVPRRRMTRERAAAPASAAPGAAPLDDRLAAASSASDDADLGAAHNLHGVFVPAPGADAATTRTVELVADDDAYAYDDPRASRRRVATTASGTGTGTATARTIELLTDDAPAEGPAPTGAVDHDPAHLSAADDPFASPPPPVGVRRTVQIKGRPTEAGRLATIAQRSMAQRHRGRSASDRVGHRPDRIALWAVALGAILILLAAMTSSSQAAVRHAKAAAPAAVTAKVAHTATHVSPASTVRPHR